MSLFCLIHAHCITNQREQDLQYKRGIWPAHNVNTQPKNYLPRNFRVIDCIQCNNYTDKITVIVKDSLTHKSRKSITTTIDTYYYKSICRVSRLDTDTDKLCVRLNRSDGVWNICKPPWHSKMSMDRRFQMNDPQHPMHASTIPSNSLQCSVNYPITVSSHISWWYIFQTTLMATFWL